MQGGNAALYIMRCVYCRADKYRQFFGNYNWMGRVHDSGHVTEQVRVVPPLCSYCIKFCARAMHVCCVPLFVRHTPVQQRNYRVHRRSSNESYRIYSAGTVDFSYTRDTNDIPLGVGSLKDWFGQ